MPRTQQPVDPDDDAPEFDILPPKNPPTAQPPTDPEETAEIDIAARMRAVLAQAPGERVTVKLYRKEKTGQLSFCENYTVEKFQSGDLEMVREDWGAGEYQIRVIGRTGLLTRQDFLIAPKITRAVSDQSAPALTEFAQILRAMHESNAQQNAAILAALNNRPDPQVQMQNTIALMASMREAMGPNNQSAANSVAPQTPSAMLKDMLESMQMLKAVTTEAPQSDSSDPMAMLPAVLDIVKSTMQARQQPQQIPHIAAPQSIAYQANPQQNAQHVPEPETNEMNPLVLLAMKGTLQKLIKMAKDGLPATAGAEFIYEKLPDDMIQFLDLPNWFDIIAHFEPSAVQYRQWIEEAKSLADAEFAKDENDSADASNTSIG